MIGWILRVIRISAWILESFVGLLLLYDYQGTSYDCKAPADGVVCSECDDVTALHRADWFLLTRTTTQCRSVWSGCCCSCWFWDLMGKVQHQFLAGPPHCSVVWRQCHVNAGVFRKKHKTLTKAASALWRLLVSQCFGLLGIRIKSFLVFNKFSLTKSYPTRHGH